MLPKFRIEEEVTLGLIWNFGLPLGPDILPLYVPSERLRFDIKNLSETRILPGFSVDTKGT